MATPSVTSAPPAAPAGARSPNSGLPSPPARRRRRADSGRALFGALSSTIGLLRRLLLGLVALYLCSGLTRVAPHEDAVIFRLGRLLPEVHPPGLLFALPAPIDRVVTIPTRTQHELFLNAWSPDENLADLSTVTAAAVTRAAAPLNPATALVLGTPSPISNLPSQIPPPSVSAPARGLHPVFDGYTLTGDVNVLQARLTARYRIVDPLAYVATTTPETASALIESAVFDAATQHLALLKIDDALGSGLEPLRRQLRDAAQLRLDALHLGLELVAVEINALFPPAATVSAFADVTSAQVEARTALEQARTYRAQTAPRAASDAYRLRAEADAEARQLIARATAEAASFRALVAEHTRAPSLLETRLRAETLEQILPRVKTKTVLPPGAAPFNLLLRDPK